MNEWWQAIITLAIGFALGVVACLLFRKRGVSDGTGTGADSVGQLVDEVVGSVSGAEERVGESVRTSESVAESVGRLADTSDESERAIREAEESVGRIRKLIEAERERDEKLKD